MNRKEKTINKWKSNEAREETVEDSDVNNKITTMISFPTDGPF